MVRADELSRLYPKRAMTILQDLYAEAETKRISDEGTLTQKALSELNPSTPEETVDVAIRDLRSNGKVEMVSVGDEEETYEITEEGYDFVDENFPTDELLSDYDGIDLSETELG